MSKLQDAIKGIHVSDAGEQGRAGKAGVPPYARLLVTFFYILLVVSFPKYDLSRLASMSLYLLVIGIWENISIKEAVRRIWPVLLLVSIVGIANPVMDRGIYWQVGKVPVTYGMISMVTLMLKGIFSVIAAYLLMITSGIEGICFSLRHFHVPKEFVTVLLLIYHYLILLLKEVERMMQAYKLRAPGQKGLQFKTWGAFVGQLLLRSMDRAEMVYESMLLRGYTGEIPDKRYSSNKGAGIWYVFLWGLVLLGLRVVPVFQIVGAWF